MKNMLLYTILSNLSCILYIISINSLINKIRILNDKTFKITMFYMNYKHVKNNLKESFKIFG